VSVAHPGQQIGLYWYQREGRIQSAERAVPTQKILADVEITDPNCSGVIFAHGSRFGGHALFIKDRKLHYVYNSLGIKPEQKFVSPELKPGKYALGMEFTRDKAGPHGESLGKTRLYVNDRVVAEGDLKTQAGKFTLFGDGLCIGRDSGDAVSQE
jgi:hypothetical protein